MEAKEKAEEEEKMRIAKMVRYNFIFGLVTLVYCYLFQPNSYGRFLLHNDVENADDYDSDRDPSFIPSTSHDIDLDFDEYSDGEVPDEEVQELKKVRKMVSH